MNKTFTLIVFLVVTAVTLIFSPASAIAQVKTTPYSAEKIESFKEDIKNLIEILTYSFNTLGDPNTTARDKDVIINQSYAKIFENAEVQIEDDLDDNREALINKDVQAYLKDIDFFFKEAVFSLNVSSIDHSFKSDGEIYFIVNLTRTLNAKTVADDTISSNKERFIEVNYDDVAQDLRIASIYTTRIDEKDELFAWWNKMSPEWRKVLGSEAFIKDSIPFSNVIEINDTIAISYYYDMREVPIDTFLVYDKDTLFINETDLVESLIRDTIRPAKNFNYRMLQRIAAEPEIDVSGNLNILSLDPLAQMGNINKVNCANTMVDDLSPLRSIINIESLDCSGTAVTGLSPMQYSVSLKNLDIHATRIRDINPLANLRNLERLNLSNTQVDSLDVIAALPNLIDIRVNNTPITEITALQNLKKLKIINISGSYVKDLSPLQDLVELERLYMNNTPVDDLAPLGKLKNLLSIYLDSTKVNSLAPLDGLSGLENIYCDNTGINGSKADAFMARNPKVLVIHESVALASWWHSMSHEWQDIFRKIASLGPDPGKEELHQAVKITQIDIEGNKSIKSLLPLGRLMHLNRLNCSGTGINNLDPLADLIDLQYLDCSNTAVSDCNGLRGLMNLEYLNISNTQIKDIQCISGSHNLSELNISGTEINSINVFGRSNLKLIYADESGLSLQELILFKKENPECTVVYQTAELEDWWSKLNTAWKVVFSSAAGIKNNPQPIDLQRIADLESIDLKRSTSLEGLEPLKKLYRLRELKMDGTQISNLQPIAEIQTLEILIISENPIEDLTPIAGLYRLKQLEFRNTPVDDLEALGGLIHLEVLDMAGTQIKKLDELSTLTKLRRLSFDNTRVRSLSPIEDLEFLELINCYNTRLNERRVRKFSEERPDCEIIFY